MAVPLREVKPKTARTKRYLDNKAPQIVENARSTLFLKYTSCSNVLNLISKDLCTIKKPFSVQFSKKNSIHPFEDPSSLEFFADKNDASLAVFCSSSKKRPHAMTLVRFFDHKVLDMLELLLDADTARTLSQFKNAKQATGMKPMLAFSGSAFDSPVANEYTLAKSLLLDMFKGEDVPSVDVQGLRYFIHISVDEEQEASVKPMIHLRCYLLSTKKSGTSVPRVEVEEIGPRIDWRMGRMKEADPDMLKEAMRKPKTSEAKTKKNVEMDIIGDKVGRIHMGKQNLNQLQTRKMKGLKRSRDDADNVDDLLGVNGAAQEVVYDPAKRQQIAA